MNKQNGSALIISLLMLLVLTMLGITSMSTSTLEEKMASNDRNQKVTFQNAEGALIESEAEVIKDDWQSDINSKIVATSNDPYYKTDETVGYYKNNTWASGNCKVPSTNTHNCYVVQLIGEQAPLTLDGGYGQADQSNKRHLKLNVTARSADLATAMVQSSIDKVDIPEI